MAELDADEANPFWKRLLEPEKAYGIDFKQEIAPILERALNTGMSMSAAESAIRNQSRKPAFFEEETKGVHANDIEQRKLREMAKIRQNEIALA